MSLLSRIISRKETAAITVVEDSVKQSYVALVRELIFPPPSGKSIKANNLIIVCCESPPETVAHVFGKKNVSSAPRFVDVFSSWSWYAPPSAASLLSSVKATTSTLASTLEALMPTGTFARLVKSLALLTSTYPSVSLILPFHGDAHTGTPVLAPLLADLATTYITVRHGKDFGLPFGCPGDADAYQDIDAHWSSGGVCEVLHRRKSGKVGREVVGYRASSTGGTWVVKTLDEWRGVVSTEVEERRDGEHPDDVDPAANLSFNLRLTDAQRAARSELVLPYLNAQQADTRPQQANPTGTIFYDDDDYDEEDPDADLDI
ncbi:hypothetical protein HKX48_005753 [Thoreauomyces humboldtii]|nr:hypothetical protein HKX48_005753 [Thoreauomyces humboldtii]